MQVRRSTGGCFAPRSCPGGFSLMEVMVVLVVIGVLTAMAVPSYQRAIEQSRVDMAAANLRAIWAAQRLYWLDNHVYTTDLSNLRTLGLLDPEIIVSTSGYVYTVTSAGADSFQAVATRTGNTCWIGQCAIDDTGTITGNVQTAGQPVITPGFQ
jgi:prepilin-type N-terminal cleavage/methylation domain-containing protein